MKGIRIFASRLGLFGIVVLVLAALSGAVFGGSDPRAASAPAEPAPDKHLLLVPDTPAATGALARTDARLVSRYESFALVEAAGADYRRLRAAGADRRDDMREVTTAAGALDPTTDRVSLAGKRAPDREEALGLVQFFGPPKPAWIARLRSTGARIITYQAENAYTVHATGAAVDRLAGLVGTDPAVRAVVPVTAADKVEGLADAPARYAVSTVAGRPGAQARDRAAAAGPVVDAALSAGTLRTQYVRLSPSEVAELAGDPAVVGIERDAAPTPDDERAGAVAAGLGQPAYLAWHNPRFPAMDVTIDVTDSGLDNGDNPSTHPDFHEGGLPSVPDRVEYGEDYTDDGNETDCTGHGTNVASIAAGYNSSTGGADEDVDGFNYGLGIAPLAKLGVSKIFRCDGSGLMLSTGDVADIAQAASAAGADISNNSWGLGVDGFWGAYSMRARAYDRVVRDAQPGLAADQPLVEVFSAGNDGEVGYGTINAEASAKNVITVGASEGARTGTPLDGCGPVQESDSPRDIAPFSARGPTNDGRLKPDLVAPGTRVTGARPPAGTYVPDHTKLCSPFFGTGYSMASGTSQAAPQVSGAAALVRQWYLDNVPGGGPPSPAMTKALLLNTATDLGGGQDGKGDAVAAGPNADQGWGRLDLGSAFDSTPREFRDQRSEDLLTTSGQTVVRGYAVQDSNKPVKVTLVWTDPPGAAFGDAFVNNLDLEVAGGGETYRGNVFGGGYSRTGGTADTRNNVESVYLPPHTSGPFSVTVRATNLPGNGELGSTDQDFALVVSNADDQPAPVLVHQSTTVAGGDGDDALESDEQVNLTEQVRNAGVGDATGVSAVLNGVPGLTVAQANSAYPTIAEDDGTEANDTPFTVHLANAATCGVELRPTLSITSASGTQTVPITLPTGEPGNPQSYPAAQVPVPIPDNGAGEASSSVFMPDRGVIKDVNVTIPGTGADPGIDHSADGDLVIDLIGPDNTTVRLADHPGGPDNNDDDFAGTTFDDEAGQDISQGNAPYTGSFRPQNDQLSRFDGKSRYGTWTLRVRDLFAGDGGTLRAWGVQTQKAHCDVDTIPPDTSIATGPANPTTATSASFALGSNDASATFECRLDGGLYEPCDPTKAYGGLALGSHTFSARAIDGSDNEDPTPAAYSWVVEFTQPPPTTPTPATSFVLAPVEEDLGDALGGRFTVVAACASACRASAKISVPARTARRLDLSRKAISLGSGATRRGSAGRAKVAVHLSKRARAALRGRKLTKVTLTVTLTEGKAKLTIKRAISLRRAAVLKRIASRGLRLWAACASRCPLSAELTLSAAQARRLGLKPGRAKRYEVASGATTGTRTPKVLKLTVRRSARKALARAHRVGALLEAIAGQAPNPRRVVKLSKTLRG